MALNDLHLHGSGEHITSDFGRLAAAIDAAERISNECIGGPDDDEDLAYVRSLESRLQQLRPTAGSDWRWLARRMAQAFENGWHHNDVKRLLILAE